MQQLPVQSGKTPALPLDTAGGREYIEGMTFSVYGSQGTIQHGFTDKSAAIAWAYQRKLADFEVIDENDFVVYQEFPEARFV